MKKLIISALPLLLAVGAFAQKNVEGGGAMMSSTKNIIENVLASKDHTTLVAALKAADLEKTLSGRGPFTVFAPTDEAFAKLRPGMVENLLKPANKGVLAAILTYHVVSGNWSSADLAKAIKDGNGKAELTTIQGSKIWAMMIDKDVIIKDEKGSTSKITIVDVKQSNGIIHVIDGVLMPK